MRVRSWVAFGVLAAWGIGLALFARRELNRPPTDRLAEVAMRVAPGAIWFAAERNGAHVGFASVTVDTVPGELQFIEYLVTGGDGAATMARLVEQTTIRLSRGLALRGLEQLRATGSDSTFVRARVSGGDTLHFAVIGESRGSDSGMMRIAPPILLAPLVPLVAALQAPLRVGASATFSIFDANRRVATPLTIAVNAESLFTVVDSAIAGSGTKRWLAVHRDTVRAWRLLSADPLVPLDVWVDVRGQAVAATRPDGLTLRRTAFELAFENWRLTTAAGGVAVRAGGMMVSSTLLAAGIPFPIAPLDSLKVRPRSPIPRAAVARLGLRVRGTNAWTAARPAARPIVARYAIPMDPAWRRGFHRSLAAEPLIEVDDSGVQRLAQRLRGGESDPLTVLESTLRWMRDSIRPAVERSKGAAEVLASRRGDANEFARLFTALLRANGIPARVVAGLLYVEGRLYHHAWTEVYVDEWIAVDPLLGQLPADGAHLALVYGAFDSQTELMRLLGRLDLRVTGAWGPAASRSRRPAPEVP